MRAKYKPTAREQGVFIVRKIGDPVPTAQEQEQLFIEALSQEQDYQPTVRDSRAKRYYGLLSDDLAMNMTLQIAKQRDKDRKRRGLKRYRRTG
jgi:hypothetical protein